MNHRTRFRGSVHCRVSYEEAKRIIENSVKNPRRERIEKPVHGSDWIYVTEPCGENDEYTLSYYMKRQSSSIQFPSIHSDEPQPEN